MNEVHFTGKVMNTWKYGGDVFVRFGIPRRSSTGGNRYDFVTLAFLDGVARGLRFDDGDRLVIHRAHARSRDEEIPLADLLAKGVGPVESVPKEAAENIRIKQSITDFVVEDYEVAS